MPKKLLLLFACLVLLLPSGHAQIKCQIIVSAEKGCIPTTDSFRMVYTNLPTGVRATKFNWNFGDGSTSNLDDTVYHIYSARGSYKPTVKIDFSDGTSCTATLSAPIRIFDNPRSNFFLTNNTIRLCSDSEKICFRPSARPGRDNAPIRNYSWLFGDGSPFSSDSSPCHNFPHDGKFNVNLSVRDTNGCANLVVKDLKVEYVVGNLRPVVKFKDTTIIFCTKAEAEVHFTNQTDTVGMNINRFVWDYGDGRRDTCFLQSSFCKSKWTNFKTRYSGSGYVSPKLYVENIYGCWDSFVNHRSIYIEGYHLNVNVSDTSLCASGKNVVSVSATPTTNPAVSTLWDFGDCRDGGNVATNTFNASHTYTTPGTYSIYFRIEFPQCTLDTVICKKIKVLGPVAKLKLDTSLDRIPYNYLQPIPKSFRPSYFDTCADVVGYYELDTLEIVNGDTVFGSYCTATVKYKKGSCQTIDCNKKGVYDSVPVYSRKVLAVRDKDSVRSMHLLWYKGMPLPDGPVYNHAIFNNRPLVYDDSDLYTFRCGPPKLVKFHNFSHKYRGYEAADNFPPGNPDACHNRYNPEFPYASDSLWYYWDFNEGTLDTSYEATSNNRARYSREKTPEHLFLDTGCFYVTLKVKDPKTGCESKDMIEVVVQQPNAGWHHSYNAQGGLNYEKQIAIGTGGHRRGFIMDGKPCLGAAQAMDFTETLPACFQRFTAIVLDSATGTAPKSCGNGVDSTRLVRNWQEDIATAIYRDTGWKTLGVVVRNNAFCADTFWYHNYKYFHKVDASIGVAKRVICPGDTMQLWLKNPWQQGIKYAVIECFQTYDGLNPTLIGRDSFPTSVYKNNLGKMDTAATSAQILGLQLYDSVPFNMLRDTIRARFTKPGNVDVRVTVYNRWGCSASAHAYITVGHYAGFSVPNPILCQNDTAKLQPIVQYYYPSARFNERDLTPYWEDPAGNRSGRTPKMPERIKWDLDGDGTIDDTTYKPRFIYKKPGFYTVKLYTKDSLGCEWQMYERKNYIRVVGVTADFSVLAPGKDVFCAPQYFRLVPQATVIDSGKPALKILKYVWEFNDGSSPITSMRDTMGYIHRNNGTYPVELRAYVNIPNHAGCYAGKVDTLHIRGPMPRFKILGDTAGCVPFALKVVDLSKGADYKDWRLGDSTAVSTTKQDTIILLYQKVGVFCPQLIGASQIRDSAGNSYYCSDTFPTKLCQFQVKVHPRPKVKLNLSDSVVCVGQDLIGVNASDTAFKSFRLLWGDGVKDSGRGPVFRHPYKQTGSYPLNYFGYGAFCPDSLSAKVRVVDVKSYFEIDGSRTDTPNFTFINQSVNGRRYRWLFEDGSGYEDADKLEPLEHRFLTPGNQRVCLVAFGSKGCADTFCRNLLLEVGVFIPNILTPEVKDGKNDRFHVDTRGETRYHLWVRNRWGQLVFESENNDIQWDGTMFNKGQTLCPAGTYYYVFDYQLLGGDPKRAMGTVTLVR